MNNRLIVFLHNHEILYKYQFGFRKGHSTNLALIEITEQLRAALDRGDYALGAYLDLSKAFDTVDHKILLNKREHYGIRGIVYNWFESYLSGRKQFTVVNNTKSNEDYVTIEVPQGSVLGPILFLIYVNDIGNISKTNTDQIMLFADDTNAFVIDNDLNQLKQNAVKLLSNLCE